MIFSKKRMIPSAAFLALISIIFLSNAFALSATDSVTGLSTQPISVSVSVIKGFPYVQILKPINGTYLTNVSLPLEFTSIDADNWFYSLDGALNVSIPGNTRFNTTEGSHSIIVYANSSAGTANNSTAFSVNLTKFFIIYDHYKGAYKGNSTQFYDFTYEELQNLSSMALEDTRYGKIVWLGVINLTNAPLNTVDLDNNTNISYNSAYVNAGYLSNLNNDAQISLYNLTLSNPRIIRNHVECSHSICTKISYSNGTLIFNVTHFAQAIFSAQESPTPTPSAAPSAAVSAGGGYVPPENVTNISLPAPIPECKENWQCSSWTKCINNTQSRTCIDANNCTTSLKKPAIQRSCIPPINIILIAILVMIAMVVMAKIMSVISKRLHREDAINLLLNRHKPRKL